MSAQNLVANFRKTVVKMKTFHNFQKTCLHFFGLVTPVLGALGSNATSLPTLPPDFVNFIHLVIPKNNNKHLLTSRWNKTLLGPCLESELRA